MKTGRPASSTATRTEPYIPSDRHSFTPENIARNCFGRHYWDREKHDTPGRHEINAELTIRRAREGWIREHKARVKTARKELKRRIAKAQAAALLQSERNNTNSARS